MLYRVDLVCEHAVDSLVVSLSSMMISLSTLVCILSLYSLLCIIMVYGHPNLDIHAVTHGSCMMPLYLTPVFKF